MYLFDSNYRLTLYWLALFLNGHHTDAVPTNLLYKLYCVLNMRVPSGNTFPCIWKLWSKSNHCKMCGKNVSFCFFWSSLLCTQLADLIPKRGMDKEGGEDSCMGFVSWRLTFRWRARGNFDFSCPYGVGGFPPVPAGARSLGWWDVQVAGLNGGVQWVNAETESWIKALGVLTSH